MNERFSLPLPAETAAQPARRESTERFSLPMAPGEAVAPPPERPEPRRIEPPQPISEEAPGELSGAMVPSHIARQVARVRERRPQVQYHMENYPMVSAGAGALPAASNPLDILYYALPMADRAGRENLLRQRYPNAQFGEDRFGNPTVQIEGQTYYMERPDPLNPQNVRGVMMRSLPSAVLGGLAAATGPAAPVSFAVGQGLAGAAGNIMSQMIPTAAGSGQAFNIPEALTEAGVSAVAPFVPQAARTALTGAGNILTRAGEAITGRFGNRPAREFLERTTPAATLPGASETVRFEDLPRGAQNLLSRESEKLYPTTASEVGERVSRGMPGPYEEELNVLPSLSRQQGPTPSGVPLNAAPGVARHPDIMPIDSDRLLGFAEREVARDTEAGRYIRDQVATRAGGRDTRIASDLEGAFGPMTPDQTDFLRNIRQSREDYARDLSNVFSNAGDLQVGLLRQRLDSLINESVPQSAENIALRRIRDYFGGRDTVPFETLHEIKDNIWKLARFGDQSIGVQPGALAERTSRVNTIGNDVNALLRDMSQPYADVMDKYVGSYDRIQAYEAGRRAFARGENMLRPADAEALLRNPETSDAFRAGVRTQIEDTLRSTPDDLRAAIRLTGGEGDYRRAIMESTFGPESTERVLSTADREALFKATEDAIARAGRVGSRGVGQTISEELQRPPIDLSMYPFPFQQIAAGAGQRALHAAAHAIKGERGPEFERGMAAFLTSRGGQTEEMLRGIMQRRLVDEALRQSRPFVSIPSAAIAREEVRSAEEPPRFAGGRVGRASGGRLMRRDHAAQAAALIRAADAAKKKHNKTTEGILDQPDEVVAKALSIANKAI